MDIAAQGAQTRYTIGRVMTGKGSRPKPVSLAECKIFNRLGSKRPARYFDEMTPEQINKRMRGVQAGIRSIKT